MTQANSIGWAAEGYGCCQRSGSPGLRMPVLVFCPMRCNPDSRHVQAMAWHSSIYDVRAEEALRRGTPPPSDMCHVGTAFHLASGSQGRQGDGRPARPRRRPAFCGVPAAGRAAWRSSSGPLRIWATASRSTRVVQTVNARGLGWSALVCGRAPHRGVLEHRAAVAEAVSKPKGTLCPGLPLSVSSWSRRGATLRFID